MSDQYGVLKERLRVSEDSLESVSGSVSGWLDRKLGVEKEIECKMGICNIKRLEKQLSKKGINYSSGDKSKVEEWKGTRSIDYVIYIIADEKLIAVCHARHLNDSLWLVPNYKVDAIKDTDIAKVEANEDTAMLLGGGYTIRRSTRKKTRRSTRKKTRRSTRKKTRRSTRRKSRKNTRRRTKRLR